MSLPTGQLYRFGDFTLDKNQKVLLRGGKPLPLAPKVFDTLLILIEYRGRIVEKEELMNRLWPDTFVEEANLTFNIQQLRKSLQDNARKPIYIETIARRGYRFIATVEEASTEDGGTGGQTSERFQIPETRSGEGREVESEAYGVRRVAELPDTNNPAAPETNINPIPTTNVFSTRPGKKTAVIVLASVIVVACIGALLWRLSTPTNEGPNDKRRTDGESAVGLPLKIEKLTLTGQSRLAAISPDGKYVAYTRAIERRAGIWLRQLATNTNVEIVPATGRVYGLAFANSGDYLYFIRGDPITLYRVSLLGGVPTRIVENVEGGFTVSADDRQIAVIRKAIDGDGQQRYTLVTANSDGGGERTLLSRTYPDKLDAPVFSPDNQSIICAYGSSEGGSQSVSLAEVRLNDGSIKELSMNRFSNIGKMAWLPLKNGLIITARKNAQDNKELWRVSYPGMEILQITEGLSQYVDVSVAAASDKAVASQATRISDIWLGSSREPRNLMKITQAIDEFCWTPNGKLLYQSTASGNRDLWITKPDGTEQRQLTNDPAVDGTPAVTPDDRYIVFTSNRSGGLQLWRMNMDGSNHTQLTSRSSASYPALSPDGQWIFYNTTDDYSLWRVSINGGEPVRVTSYVASFPSISPDGKMVACVGRSVPRRELSILIVSIESGQPVKRINVTGAGFLNDRIQWTPDGRSLLYAAERDVATVITKHPVAGGPPEDIMDFNGATLFDFGYSFDGQFFAVTRGEWQHDIVLIDGLNRN